jgi:hypothetical protein
MSSRIIRLSTLAALLFLVATGPSAASAQNRGNSGLPDGPGNPIADLQRQLDALGQRVADLEAAAAGAVAVAVDCSAGETIAAALALPAGSLTITVVGTCDESVVVARNDVTLTGTGTLAGPSASVNTLTITGDRAVVDGLTLTGGRNGVTVAGGGRAVLRNCTVQGAGRTGVVFFQGGNGTVENCTIQGSGRDGVAIEGAAATIIHTTITGNDRMGVTVTNGGSARIGLDNTNALPATPTTVSGNAGAGLFVTVGGQAFVAGTTISGNGLPGTQSIRDGVHIFQATVDLMGSNTISANAAHGVNVIGGRVLIGDTVVGIPGGILNTITGNGALVANSNGVSAFLNATVDIRGADISGNTGNGVGLNAQSSARVTGATINDNTGNGIGLTNGSGLILGGSGLANPVATGNGGGFALGCTAGQPENSFAGAFGPGSQAIGGNCSGF